MGVRTLCIVFLLLMCAPQAHAACSDPNGEEGDVVYNGDHNVVQFCTGAAWIAMGGGGGGGGTTTIGTLDADKWCQADNTGSVINCTADAPSGGGGGKFVDGTNAADAVYTTGKVGVGTASPTRNLDVVGSVLMGGASASVLVQGLSGILDLSAVTHAIDNFTPMQFSTGGTPAMYIGTNNRVGIGTVSPNSLLHVSGNGTVQIDGSAPSYHSLFNYSTNRDVYIRAGTAGGKIVIGDQNTGKVEMTGPGDKVISGNVGIGTATPTQKLDVAGTVKATNLESRGSVIILKLASCGGGACGSYHALNAWVDTGTYSLTWDTFLNTNPALYTHTGNGHITVNKAGVYRITERHMMYSGSTHQYIYGCPYVNGVRNCGTGEWPEHGYYPGGYWYNMPLYTIVELPAGADVTFGYYIYVAMTYWAHDGYTQFSIERIN